VHPDDREKTEREAAALAEGNTTVQFRNRYFDRDGRVHWLEWASVPLLDEHIIYGVARDITDRKELEQELERRSQRDPLTGAFNRRRFDEELTNRLVDARRYERKGALLLADLDRLKQINDELGHGAGDLALCEVARLFDENLRGGDAIGRDADGIVARLGGDEFAVLLAEVDEEQAVAVAERLVADLETTDLRIEGSRVPLSISVGVAAFEGGVAVDAGTLVAVADRALYTVKASGGGAAARAPARRRELGPEPA
jgi:diguanylate cyclase (GGDEF)-like protein